MGLQAHINDGTRKHLRWYSQTSMMDLAKSSIINVWQGPKYTSNVCSILFCYSKQAKQVN